MILPYHIFEIINYYKKLMMIGNNKIYDCSEAIFKKRTRFTSLKKNCHQGDFYPEIFNRFK